MNNISNGLRTSLFYFGMATWTMFFGTLIMICAPLTPSALRHGLYVRNWALVVIFMARWICGIKYRISGSENIPKHSAVIASNHQSTWETFFLQTIFTPQAQVVKKELLSVPFFGWAFRSLNPIAIDRSNPKQALRKITELGGDYLHKGCSVLVFPEGTRRKHGDVGKFSQGAAAMAKKGEVAIIPVAHNAGTIWPNKSWIKQAGTIDVVIGSPIELGERGTKEVTLEIQEWVHARLSELP